MELSVVIPCRNSADTLLEQLDALALQQWDGSWEVVLVDNGSTDDSVAIAERHAGLAGRLRVVLAPDVRGVAAVRRRGVESSNARSVVFCDGDDVVGPTWVAALGDALRNHDVVVGQIDVERLNPPALAASRGTASRGRAPRYGAHAILSGGNGGMSRATWDRYNGFDEHFNGLEDIELSLRLAAGGEHIEFVPDALLHYRYRSGAKAIWHQGRFYGASQVSLARRCRTLGLTPPRSHAWKSWAWLMLHAPTALLPARRLAWLWVLACRVGAARAATRYRLGRIVFNVRLAWGRRPIRSSGVSASAPLHLLTIAFGNPKFTAAQLQMLRDCLLDEHTVTVADNSPVEADAAAIRETCRSMGVEYLRLHRNPYTGNDPSRSHAEAVRAALRHLHRRNRFAATRVLGLLDHDIFPTTGTTVMDRMHDHVAYGTRRTGTDCWYLWPGLLFLDLATFPVETLDLSPVLGRGDTGCAMYFRHLHAVADEQCAFTNAYWEPAVLTDGEVTLEWHDSWIHALNGSYWKAAVNKDDAIVEALQQHGLVS